MDNSEKKLKELLESWEGLTLTLKGWLAKGLQRADPLPPLPQNLNPKVWDLAIRIYKRGFQSAPSRPPAHFTTKIEVLGVLPTPPAGTFLVLDWALVCCGHAASPGSGVWHWVWEPSESQKNLDFVKTLLEAIPPSAHSVWAFGGGATLDLAGFAASLRGLPFCGAPSTLLAAVDAGLGGKVGVNVPPYGKNQVGAFWPMKTLWLVPSLFSSLSPSQRAEGLCEAAKHSWLRGSFERESFEFVSLLNGSAPLDVWQKMTLDHLHFKSQVVSLDPWENRGGCRVGLNLGHTLGHVLEALSSEGHIGPLSHGHCVALGMKALQPLLKGGPRSFWTWIFHLLSTNNSAITEGRVLAYSPKKTIKERVLELMHQDKKNINSKNSHLINCVLPRYGEWQHGVAPLATSPRPTLELQDMVMELIETGS